MSRIVSFYSYKGGVGRTMAMANVAVLLARQGKKVLLMDWDLEAPGLDLYFRDAQRGSSPTGLGLIHLLHEVGSNPDVDWRTHVEQFTVQTKNTSPSETVSLSLLASGVASPNYANRVQEFSWKAFMQMNGGEVLERWRVE